MTSRVYTNSKEKIISAACQVLIKKGLSGLTTDSVIAQSGLSKAGFFYNFKTKDALLMALAEKLISDFLESMAQFEKNDPNPTGRSLRSYLRAMFNTQPKDFEKHMALNRAFAQNFPIKP